MYMYKHVIYIYNVALEIHLANKKKLTKAHILASVLKCIDLMETFVLVLSNLLREF